MMRNVLLTLSAAVGMTIVGSSFAAGLTGKDLSDCDVLIGGKKRPEYKKLLDKLANATDAGDLKSGLDLAGILNNRFVCLEEELSGDESWTVSVESGGHVETTHRPVVKSIKEHPEAYSALKDVVTAYERLADKNLSARATLGSYYARYHDTLKKDEDGYVYIASAYEAECARPVATSLAKTHCSLLKQDKMLYLPLLNADQRSRLDRKALAWVAQYSNKHDAKQAVPVCNLAETPLEREVACPRFREADTTLNRTYKALISDLDKDTGAMLRHVQRTWIKWRDKKCDLVQEESGCNFNGSCNGVAHDECIIQLTAQRTRELEEFSKNTSAAKNKGFAFSRHYQ
ncbi:MAG TPA: lysozyme inhibitor LprI family protein [Noviherbaspirillum sp.]